MKNTPHTERPAYFVGGLPPLPQMPNVLAEPQIFFPPSFADLYPQNSAYTTCSFPLVSSPASSALSPPQQIAALTPPAMQFRHPAYFATLPEASQGVGSNFGADFCSCPLTETSRSN